MAKGPKVSIIDSQIPKPGPNQVVTKVIYSGSNPKDWKVPGILQVYTPPATNDVLTGNDQNGCPTSHP